MFVIRSVKYVGSSDRLFPDEDEDEDEDEHENENEDEDEDEPSCDAEDWNIWKLTRLNDSLIYVICVSMYFTKRIYIFVSLYMCVRTSHKIGLSYTNSLSKNGDECLIVIN